MMQFQYDLFMNKTDINKNAVTTRKFRFKQHKTPITIESLHLSTGKSKSECVEVCIKIGAMVISVIPKDLIEKLADPQSDLIKTIKEISQSNATLKNMNIDFDELFSVLSRLYK